MCYTNTHTQSSARALVCVSLSLSLSESISLSWEPEIFSPYQIALDDDGLIHAPADVNECIRAL